MVRHLEAGAGGRRRRRRWPIAAALAVVLVVLVLIVRANRLPSIGVVQLGSSAEQTVRLANRSDEAWQFRVTSGTDAADIQLPAHMRGRCDVAQPADGKITVSARRPGAESPAVLTLGAVGLGAHEVVIEADGTLSGGTVSLATLAGL